MSYKKLTPYDDRMCPIIIANGRALNFPLLQIAPRAAIRDMKQVAGQK